MRAWLRIVEVAIAGAMLLLFFAYISGLIRVERPTLEEGSEMARVAREALFILDNTPEGGTSVLRGRVKDLDFARLHEQTLEVLPSEYRFRYIIGEAETGGIPPKTEVVHQSYFVVMPDGETQVVRLYVWRRDL